MKASAQSLCNNVLTRALKEKIDVTPMKLQKLLYYVFALGSSMLGWCLFLMLICIVLSLWYPDNELIKNGFEAFKLIVMTILGYIFGSNHTKKD